MPTLDTIAEALHRELEARTAARDRALTHARQLVRACAHAIRATHRDDHAQAAERLEAARTLDLLRHGYSPETERLLGLMDDIYAVLVTMDYPDAVTYGLRRLTDIARSPLERTRGDVTLSLRQDALERSLRRLEDRLPPD